MDKNTQGMKRWEYKIIEDILPDKELNKLGYEGWELVSYSYNAIPDEEVEFIDDHIYTFKREIQPIEPDVTD